MEGLVAQKESEIAELKSRPDDCEELESRVAELEGLVAQKDSEIEELQERTAAIDGKQKSNQNDLMNVSVELSSKDSEISQLKLTIAEKENAIALLQAELFEYQKNNTNNAKSLPPKTNAKVPVSRLVDLPEFLSNFKDIQIKIKPDLAIGLKRIFRTQRQKNTHQEGSEAAIDSSVREAVYEILKIMGPSSADIDHDRLESLLSMILEHHAFAEFASKNAAGLNITTPMHIEEMSYKLLKYIVDEAHKAMGGKTRRNKKTSRNSTRRR